jgi:hypothetical protein
MIITLERKVFNKTSTEGNILIDGKWFCHVIEDVVRAEPGKWKASCKVQNKTAIPYGTYPVLVTWSSRFKRQLTGIFNVPNFEGIRIHNGTTELSSAGCPIVSYKAIKGAVVNLKSAMNDLCDMVEAAQQKGKVIINIIKA